MHLDIATRTIGIALTIDSAPNRVLDVGCGTRALLRLLADLLMPEQDTAPSLFFRLLLFGPCSDTTYINSSS